VKARRASSLRGRLVILLLVASALLLTGAIGLSWRDARRELNELFDAQLAESARVLLMQAGHELREATEHGLTPPSLELPAGHRYAQRLHVQIRDARGRLLYRSSADLPPEPHGADARDGFADRTFHGTRWRVLLLTDPASGLQAELCQTYEGRERLAASIVRNMLLPLVIALPLLGALIWITTTRGIRPLSRLAEELEKRAPQDLEPLRPGPLPRELEPMVGSLNGLLERLRARFDVERRFTADAAHELRTPLAALKTQAQVATGARTPAELDHALSQIVRGVDRMTHLVAQLLTLARLDPDPDGAGRDPVDLASAAREAVEELAPEAAAKGMPLHLEAKGAAAVAGDRALLRTLARNLVENAIRHGRAGDAIRVVVDAEAAFVSFDVVDAGPGISPELRDRVFDRFYRGSGGSASGSGLGLSIVHRIAELHHATVTLGDGPGGRGLRVTVRFPALLRTGSDPISVV